MAKKKISSNFIYFFGAFGGILFGYDIGVMTGALPFLQTDWNLAGNASITGWITSSLMLGAIFGGALAGQLSDRLGRRRMILMSAVVFAVFALASAFAPTHGGAMFLIAMRVFLGLGVGAASALVPAFMSEMAPAKVRGRLSGINQVMIVSGMLISYIVDYLLQGLPTGISWRMMIGMAAVPAVILFLGVLRLPESPRFLVKQGKLDEARQVLSWIRPADEVASELADIQATATIEKKATSSTNWGSLLSGRYRYLVIAGIGVAAFQQFQGANAIFYYIPLIVQSATGKAATSALMWPIIQGVILVAGSLFFLVIADRFNRRTLLTVGGTIMGLSFLLPAILNMVSPSLMKSQPMLLVVFLSIYVALYSCTWAPLTWVIVGEVFPLAIRGRASGLASSFNWIGSFLVGLLFPIMTAAMSQAAVFGIFGLICLLGVVFIRTRVPETRGHSLEEIEEAGAQKAGIDTSAEIA